jgi:hypothetical protein
MQLLDKDFQLAVIGWSLIIDEEPRRKFMFSLAKNRGFADHELNQMDKIVLKYQRTFIEAWHDYFGA